MRLIIRFTVHMLASCVACLNATTAQVVIVPVATTSSQAPGLQDGVRFSQFGYPVVDAHGNVTFSARLTGSPWNSTVGYWRYGTNGGQHTLLQQSYVPGSTTNYFGQIYANLSPGGTPGTFLAGIAGPGVTSNTNAGIWSFRDDVLTVVAQEGTQAPGLSLGAVIEELESSFDQGLRRANQSGRCVFGARLSGVGVTSLNDMSIWSDSAGSLQLLAREGTQAPGTAAGTLFSGFSVARLSNNGSGYILAKVAGPGVTILDDLGIWRFSGGSLSLLAREGSQAPGLPTGVYFATSFGDSRLGTLVASRGDFAAATGRLGGPGTQASDFGLFRWFGAEPLLIARSGDTAPGTNGALFADFLGELLSISNDGSVLFGATLQLASGVNQGNDTGIWVYGPSGIELVFREGDFAPGLSDETRLSTSGIAVRSVGAGQVVLVSASLTGPLVATENNTCLLRWSPDTGLEMVWRAGDAAPGEGNGVVLSYAPGIAFLNSAGTPVMFGDVRGPGITFQNDGGWWAYSYSAGLYPIVREGSTVDVSLGDVTDLRQITGLSAFSPDANVDGLAGNIFYDLDAAAPIVAFNASFTGGSGIFVATLPNQCASSVQVAGSGRAIEGMRRRLTAQSNGTTPISWAWFDNGQAIVDGATFVGATSNQLTWMRPSLSDTARQVVARARLSCGDVDSAPTSLTVVRRGDWDANGGNDIVWRNAASGANVVWNCDGTPSDNSFVTGTRSLPSVGDVAWTIVGQGDVNQDGMLDLIWRNVRTGDNAAWLMNGTVYAGAVSMPRVADANWEIRGIGDFNLDGVQDLLWRSRATGANVLWYMNDAFTGTIGTGTLPSVSDPNWQIEGVADFDSNGHVDVLWRNARSGATAVWYLNGASVVGAADVSPAQSDVAWRVLAAMDFNNDGKTDIAWRNTLTGANELWLMNVVNRITVVPLPGVSDTFWRGMGQARFRAGLDGDFNGDGAVDIMWRNVVTGANSIWLMNGTQYSGAVNMIPIGDPNWRIQATADLTRDNQTDVFWRNVVTGQNVLWQMSGTSRVASIDLPSVSDTNWYVGACVDVDGDEMTDLVWYNESTRDVLVWYLNPLRTPFVKATASLPQQSSTSWRLRGAGDINRDGRMDLMFRGASANEAWLMNGVSRTSISQLPSVEDPTWDIRSVSDFDRDGLPDLLWRNTLTGANTIWLMNGTSVRSSVVLPAVSDTNWQISR
jgi:hypothetical protein